jgi:hypothetical protein
LAIAGIPVRAGEVGVAYAPVMLVATGGLPPYSWSIASGALPPGLTLSAEGKVSGTPGSAGSFVFSAHVADSSAGGATASASVKVYSAVAATAQPCSVKCSIGAGCSKCGGFGTVSGGLPPYSYKVIGGAVPQGMTLNNLAVSGPFPAGNYNLAVQVTDQLGGQATVSANWFIYGPLKLGTGSTCTDSANPPQCSTTGWTYSGFGAFGPPKPVILGYGQYCPALTNCLPKPTGPPPGWTYSVKNGTITFSAGGVPCNTPGYAGYVILDLVDTAQCAATAPSNAASLLVNISNNC